MENASMQQHQAEEDAAERPVVPQQPVLVHQEHATAPGYVWDAHDAIDMRRSHRLLGAFVGGVANFKSQNTVLGVPLQLGPDEVALAVNRGWARVALPSLAPERHMLLPPPAAPAAPGGNTAQQAGNPRRRATAAAAAGAEPQAKQQQQQHPQRLPQWLQGYYQHYEALGAYDDADEALQAQQQEGGPPQEPQQQQQTQGPPPPSWLGGAKWLKQYYAYCDRQGLYNDGSGAQDQGGGTAAAAAASQEGDMEVDVPAEGGGTQEEGVTAAAPARGGGRRSGRGAGGRVPRRAGGPAWGEAVEAGWKAAIKESGGGFALPIKAPPPGHHQGGDGAGPADAPPHAHPGGAGAMERVRHAVFADLHQRGYATSAGPKFGGDLLAYPGDPSLFHAQFSVRLVRADQPLNLMAFKAMARGSHGARKHMLLASARPSGHGGGEGEEQRAMETIYVSVAPEAGFGK